MSYKQIDPKERNEFYNYSSDHFYPFRRSVDPLDEYIPVDKGGLGHEPRKRFFPLTGGEIKADYTQYNPVRYANYFLRQAIKFSGDKVDDLKLTEALADVNSWMGNIDSAVFNYDYALRVSPKNVGLRNKLIDVLRLDNQLPEVAKNLEFLQRSNQLKPAQKLELARYSMLQKKFSVSGLAFAVYTCKRFPRT